MARKVFQVRIKRVQYGIAVVACESAEQAASVALDSVVSMVLPPYDAFDEVVEVNEVVEDDDAIHQ